MTNSTLSVNTLVHAVVTGKSIPARDWARRLEAKLQTTELVHAFSKMLPEYVLVLCHCDHIVFNHTTLCELLDIL